MVVQLRRVKRKLLGTVNGKPHAGPEDHESESTDRSPEGSSDEGGENEEPTSPITQVNQPTKSVPKAKAIGEGGKRKAGQENQDPNVKRRKSAASEPEHTFEPKDAFGFAVKDTQPRKRTAKYGQPSAYSGGFNNFHANKPKDEQKGKANGNTGNSFRHPKTLEPSSSKRDVTFRSPPESSPLISLKASQESSFCPPPPQTTDLPQKSTTLPFILPPASPKKCLGWNTRSTRKTITPEPSQSLLEAMPQIQDIIDLSPRRSPSPDDVIEVDKQCPTCSKTVPEEMLAQWRAKYPKMTIRIQQQFCREHTLQSAKQSFEERYPDYKSVINIDWEKLNKRIEDLQGHMMWLIERPEKSFYRAEFERSVVDGGGSRTLMKQIIGQSKRTPKWDLGATSPATAGRVSVGYYGTRGLKMMMDFITKNFSNALRDRVGSDKLIAARDVSGYIQMVLAPEVATRLIQDDMDVNDSRAREIMSDTAELGDQLHGSIDDTGQ